MPKSLHVFLWLGFIETLCAVIWLFQQSRSLSWFCSSKVGVRGCGGRTVGGRQTERILYCQKRCVWFILDGFFFDKDFAQQKKKRFCPQGFPACYENCRGIWPWMGIVFPGQACALSAIWSLYCSTDSNVQRKNVKKVQKSVPSKEQAVLLLPWLRLSEVEGVDGGMPGFYILGQNNHPNSHL